MIDDKLHIYVYFSVDDDNVIKWIIIDFANPVEGTWIAPYIDGYIWPGPLPTSVNLNSI